MSITAELQSLSPTALIELLVLDMTNLPGGVVSYFHAGVNGLQLPLYWQGQQYTPLPLELTGFDVTAKGAMPRPQLRVANIDGIFSAEVHQNDDLIGCKIIRKRTFYRYLDAANYPGGVNPDADANQHLPDDVWFIDRKLSENKHMIEWELASAFDLMGVMLPYRQVIQNSCAWKYRGPECGFTGAYRDKNDLPCAAAQDSCSKRLVSCEARFGVTSILPYGGFPGAARNG